MKIGILILTIILISTSLNAFRFKWPYAILGNDPTKPRFMQSNLNLKEKYSLQNLGKRLPKNTLKMKISIIKETDSLEDTPITLDTECELSKGSIKLYEFGVVRSEISYLDFFFLDGVVLFDDLTFFMKIHTTIYLDIMNNLRPKVEMFAKRQGINEFNKYCFFAFRRKPRDSENPQLGIIYTSVIFCLDQNSSNEVLAKFSSDFIRNYQKAVVSETDLNKIQQYRLKQNIMIQYYDPMEKISIENPRLPNFYTSFAKEGLVLNESENYDPKQVKYSFRFDQIVQCTADEASTLKKVINPKVASLFKDDECCVSYLVDWNQKGVKNMFCSMYSTKWKCRVDIKIFESTLYSYCLEQQLEKIQKVKKIYKRDLGKAKMYFLERVAIISALKSVQFFNLDSLWDKNSYLYKIIKDEKKVIKEDLFACLKAFDKEIADNKKGIVSGCDNLIDLQNKKEDKPKAPQKTVKNDFETTNSPQEKQKFSPAIISLNTLEELKYRFCNELKKMLKNDKQIEINYNEKKKQEEEEELEKTSKSKKHQILALFSSIKSIMIEFSTVDINRIIKILLHHPDILDQLIIKRIKLTKDVINEILINSVEDAVRILRAFVNDKVFKIDYEADPTHKNTTTICIAKSNTTKADNKTEDKPGEDEDFKKDDLPDILDEPTGYFDESDYYAITGTPINLSDKAKNAKAPKHIFVPRNIPKLKKPNEVAPVVPTPYHFDSPKPVIPIPNHDDEEPHPFPSQPNPGMISDSDQSAIKDNVNKENSNDNNNNDKKINKGGKMEADSKGLVNFLKENKINPNAINNVDPKNPNTKKSDNKDNIPKGDEVKNPKKDNPIKNVDNKDIDLKGDSGNKKINKPLDPKNKDADKEKDKNKKDANEQKKNEGENNKFKDPLNDKDKKDIENPKHNKDDNKNKENSKNPLKDNKEKNKTIDDPNKKNKNEKETPRDNNATNDKKENKDENKDNKSDPIAPSDPTNPTGPKNPIAPTGPKNPIAPTGPTNPVAPISPTNPTVPTYPIAPTNPIAPTDPTNPTSPTNPIAPTDPSKPFVPTDPKKNPNKDSKGEKSKDPLNPTHPLPNPTEENKNKDNRIDPKNPPNNNAENKNNKNGMETGKYDPSKGGKNPTNAKDKNLNPSNKKSIGSDPKNSNSNDKNKKGNNTQKVSEKDLEVFSASVTRHLGDPTKPPVEMGRIYKNPVEPESAKRLLTVIDQLNSDLSQGTVKKRKLKKLYY